MRVLVVGNPCNTNCLIAPPTRRRIPADRWFAMTMLDENRGRSPAGAAGRHGSRARSATWRSGATTPRTQFPDFYHANIGGRPAPEVIGDEDWLQSEFIATVQQRGAAIIEARGQSSAASAANAVVDTVRNITQPTGSIFSAAIPAPADASGYGIPEGLVFGYPLRATAPGRWRSCRGSSTTQWAQSKVDATRDELVEEREAVKDLLP